MKRIMFRIVFLTMYIAMAVVYFNQVIQKEQMQIKPSFIIRADDMIGLINKERAVENLEPLVQNEILKKTATIKACDMRDNNYFAHDNLQGEESWYLFKENGYSYSIAGENLIKDFDSESDAMVALMNSEKHRDNIMHTRYTEVGIGKCGIYTVQHFGHAR